MPQGRGDEAGTMPVAISTKVPGTIVRWHRKYSTKYLKIYICEECFPFSNFSCLDSLRLLMCNHHKPKRSPFHLRHSQTTSQGEAIELRACRLARGAITRVMSTQPSQPIQSRLQHQQSHGLETTTTKEVRYTYEPRLGSSTLHFLAYPN
jgi:hypothetical protein